MISDLPTDESVEVADRVSSDTVDRLDLLLGDRLLNLGNATIEFSALGKCYSVVVRRDGTVSVTHHNLSF